MFKKLITATVLSAATFAFGFTLTLTLTLTSISSLTFAAEAAYNETANAKADIRSALADAKLAKVPVLIVFGANWCGDCKVLDIAFKSGSAAPLIAKHFKIVKVDVGRMDRNVDIADSYGVPLKKGIPAVAILSAEGNVIYLTKAGELADARNMGDKGIYDFFAQAVTAKQ